MKHSVIRKFFARAELREWIDGMHTSQTERFAAFRASLYHAHAWNVMRTTKAFGTTGGYCHVFSTFFLFDFVIWHSQKATARRTIWVWTTDGIVGNTVVSIASTFTCKVS
jgi:hypothetical protein